MTRLPVVKSLEVVAALERAGFAFVKRESSHIKVHPDGRIAIVVDYGSGDYPTGTLRKLPTRIGMTVAEFAALVKG